MLKRRETVKTKLRFQDHSVEFESFCTESFMHQIVKDNGYFIHEPDVIAPIVNFVKPGDICIDAGANIGFHSLVMARTVGDSGQVLAFEPDPVCFPILKDNIELNDVGHICLPMETALWEGNIEAAEFYLVDKGDDTRTDDSPYECGYSTFVRYKNKKYTPVTVSTVKLDDIVHPEAPIRLLKIDCEGAEEGILHGAEKLLRRGVDAVICEFNFKISNNDKDIRKYMAALGYEFFYLFDNGHLPQRIGIEYTIQPSERRWYFNGLFAKQSFVKSNWRYCVAV